MFEGRRHDVTSIIHIILRQQFWDGHDSVDFPGALSPCFVIAY
jgi:hypothetical protein